MAQLPSLVIQVGRDGGVDVIASLLHVQQRKVIVGDLAGGHEAPDLALAQLLVLALDGSGRQADASLVELAGDEDGLAADEQVVAGEVVSAAQRSGRHAVSEGEGLDGVVVVVQEVEGVVVQGGFLVDVGGFATTAAAAVVVLVGFAVVVVVYGLVWRGRG